MDFGPHIFFSDFGKLLEELKAKLVFRVTILQTYGAKMLHYSLVQTAPFSATLFQAS